MKKLERIVLLLLIVGLFSSCDVQEVELVSVENIELVKMQNNIMFFNVTAILDNPNSFDIKLVDSDLDLFLGGNKISKANFSENLEIKKNSKEKYTIHVETDVIDQSKLLPIMVQTALTGKANVKVQGFVKGKVYFISRKVPIDMEDTVEIGKGILKQN